MANITQDMGGAQMINIADPINAQDAMTMNSANNTASGIPRLWNNGVSKTTVKEFCGSSTVSSGSVTFNLTTDGTSTGPAIFSNVYQESTNLWINDASNQYQFGGYSLSGNKKTLTFTINKLGTVIAGLIQFISAANGVTVYLQIKGD